MQDPYPVSEQGNGIADNILRPVSLLRSDQVHRVQDDLQILGRQFLQHACSPFRRGDDMAPDRFHCQYRTAFLRTADNRFQTVQQQLEGFFALRRRI